MGSRVAVALGSGGARGYAHVGALQVLTERGHQVVTLAGTSMGALVGGVYAAGKFEAYTDWALSLTQREVWRLLDLNLMGPGAIRAERVIGKVAEILEGALIEDLAIPFTAVATDLAARREVWFQRGPVSTAIRASVSIPGLVTPVVVDGRTLVDGGLMNTVPIEPTTAIPSDFTLAVSLSGPRAGGLKAAQDSATPVAQVAPAATGSGPEPAPDSGSGSGSPIRSLGSKTIEEWSGRLRASAAELFDSEAKAPRWELATRELGAMEVFNRSFDTMAALITRYRMASNPPDVLVTVPSDACRTMDFHRAEEIIALGRRLTEEALDAAGH